MDAREAQYRKPAIVNVASCFFYDLQFATLQPLNLKQVLLSRALRRLAP